MSKPPPRTTVVLEYPEGEGNAYFTPTDLFEFGKAVGQLEMCDEMLARLAGLPAFAESVSRTICEYREMVAADCAARQAKAVLKKISGC